MAENTRKTANEPVEAADPGGTRPAPSHGDKTRPTVQSGDRNKAPNDEIHDADTNKQA